MTTDDLIVLLVDHKNSTHFLHFLLLVLLSYFAFVVVVTRLSKTKDRR